MKHAAANALRIDIGRNFCTTKDEKGSQKDELKSSSHEPQNESTQSTQPPKTPADQPTVKKAEGHTNTLGSAVHNIASTLHFTQQMYETLEKRVMQGVHQKNQQRFRAMLLSVVVLFAWITVVFGTRIRKYFTDQTAGLAKETLENESLKIQTQELATAVVQTILEDKDITSHAATFLKEASTAPETQQALLKLTMHILQHKDTLDEVTNIAQKLIKNLANDKVRDRFFAHDDISGCFGELRNIFINFV